jgi:two-component system NtrC family sensor kinase
MAKRIEIESPVPDVPANRRILVVDDNVNIHGDFRKILGDSDADEEMAAGETALFGATDIAKDHHYDLDFASSGEQAIEMVSAAEQAGREYAMMFLDVRMAPGIDGVETAMRLLQSTEDLQIVLCTAYSDYSWEEMHRKLGETDRLVILKKPFDTIEVLQCASTLTAKWRLQKESSRRIEGLTTFIEKRMIDRPEA